MVLLGIALGVASVVAVHLISLRVSLALEAVGAPYLGGVTHVLERADLEMQHYFDLRSDWRAGRQPRISGLVPMVEGQLVLGGRAVTVLGVDAFSGLPATLPLAALPPRGLIAAPELARALGLSIEPGSGHRALLPVPDNPTDTPFRIVRELPGLDDALLLCDLGTAQELLGAGPDFVSRVGVRVEHPLRQLEDMLERLLPGFGAGFEPLAFTLEGWQVRSIDAELPSRAFARSILFNLGALGSLALLVSWLLVYQAAVIWLRRRRRTMELLEFLGVSRMQLATGFLLSLLPMAVLATVAGVAGGTLLARLLGSITTAGLDVTTPLPELDGWIVGKALASGVAVSLIGGLMAFRQEWPAAKSRVIGPVLVVVGLAVWFGITRVEALWGGFLAIAGVALGAMLLVRPLLEQARRLARGRPLTSLFSRLGLRELVWYPRELSVAVAALSLAVATSVAIGVMVDSFRREFAAMLELRLDHDLFARSGGRDVSPAARMLPEVPGVTRVDLSGRARVRVEGVAAELGYTTFDARETARYGLGRPLGADQALASERLLRELERHPGERIRLGPLELTVAGAFPGFGDAIPRLLVDNTTASRVLPELVFDRVAVDADDPADAAARLADAFPGLDIQLAAPLKELALDIFDSTFAITRALTLLALLVACIGLYNALQALKLNQTRTLHLLTTMGALPGELVRVQLWRGVGVGAAVLVIAVPLGLAMAWLLCRVVNPRAFGWSVGMFVSTAALAPPLLIGAGVTLLTSLLPMPREALDDAQDAGLESPA